MKTTIVNMWCGPRNCSTALMYAIAQHSQITVIDEPLYGHYLRITDAPHPDKAKILAHMETDGNKVMQDLLTQTHPTPVLWLKQMTHHLVDLESTFLAQTEHCLLIRHPYEVIGSLTKVLEQPCLRDVGIKQQYDLYQQLQQLGKPVHIIDAKTLLLNPKKVLAKCCQQMGIDFEESMLHWTTGPKPYDGIWAEHWYANVHQSIGFSLYQERHYHFSEELQTLLDLCLPYYEALSELAFKVD